MEIRQNETQMGLWLLQNGPISVCLNANAMHFYRGGVSHPFKFMCDPSDVDHGVLIVGYREHDYPLFDKKLHYRLIKNSDTSRAATMRTGEHTFGYFIQLYPSNNFQLQHEELAEVEQGGAVGRGLSSARSSCSVAARGHPQRRGAGHDLGAAVLRLHGHRYHHQAQTHEQDEDINISTEALQRNKLRTR